MAKHVHRIVECHMIYTIFDRGSCEERGSEYYWCTICGRIFNRLPKEFVWEEIRETGQNKKSND